MIFFGTLLILGYGCHRELTDSVIPTALSEAELGVIYPPFGGRLNAFSSKYGPIYQDKSCFVVWNRAREQGAIAKVKVPCPDTMWHWDNCSGLLTIDHNGQCECQALDRSSPQVVSCPKPSKT